MIKTILLAAALAVPVIAPAHAFDLGSPRIDDCRSGTNFSRCGQGAGTHTTINSGTGKPNTAQFQGQPPGGGDDCDKGDKHRRHHGDGRGNEKGQGHNDAGDKGSKGGQGNKGETHTGGK